MSVIPVIDRLTNCGPVSKQVDPLQAVLNLRVAVLSLLLMVTDSTVTELIKGLAGVIKKSVTPAVAGSMAVSKLITSVLATVGGVVVTVDMVWNVD